MRLVRMLCLMAGAAVPASTAAQDAPPRAQFFDSDGVRIRYVVLGEGPPVLLVHGFATSVELNWGGTGVLDALAPSYRVIAVDLRGHGLSDKPHAPDAYGVRLVGDLVNLLDHLGIDRAHVVGYSLGAVITSKLMTLHPERVRSAVLGGGGWFSSGELPPWRAAWLKGLDRAAGEGTNITAGEGTNIMDVLRMPDWPPLDPAVEAAINRNDPAALAAVLRSDIGLAITEAELRANDVPALALIGADDVMARDDVAGMERIMGNLDVVRVPGANHVSLLFHPEFVERIRQFLSSAP